MPIKAKALIFGTLVALAASIGGLRSCERSQAQAKPKPAPLVSITHATAVTLPLQLHSQGHMVPLKQVEVRAQVDAPLRKIHFNEGDTVQRGQLLFTLDDAELSVQLERARAQAAQVKAQLEDAVRARDRGHELAGTGYISSSAMDTLAANVKSLQAQRRAALAEVEAARVQLSHTRISAPMTGMAGAVVLHEGNLVRTGDGAALVSLLQFDPIAADFSVSEQHLDTLRLARERGQMEIVIRAADGMPLQGELFFVDNKVNTGTGTVQLKARFSNPDNTLWPGAFARIELSAGNREEVITLPPQAVLEGPDGHFVYQLDADRKARVQAVTLLRVQDRQAVVSGLTAGALVIVEGNQGLHDGSAVSLASSTPRGNAQ